MKVRGLIRRVFTAGVFAASVMALMSGKEVSAMEPGAGVNIPVIDVNSATQVQCLVVLI